MPTASSKNSLLQTVYLLGLWYARYRIVLALLLSALLLLSVFSSNDLQEYSAFYSYGLLSYVCLTIVQFVILKRSTAYLRSQLFILFVLDVIFLSVLTFSSGGPTLEMSLLFIILVFCATVLLEKRTSLFIMLAAAIIIIYQNFISSIFGRNDFESWGNSALLSSIFICIHWLGHLAKERFQLLENLAENQSYALHQLQHINRYILEQIETGYLVLDEDLNMILANPAALNLLGLSHLSRTKTTPLDRIYPEFYQCVSDNIGKHAPEFKFNARKSNSFLSIELKFLKTYDQNLSLLVIQDLQRINQQVQQLKLAALGQLSASIAHEIRNPLAAIVQANDLIQGSTMTDIQMLRELIVKQSNRINRIIEDTLGMVKSKKTEPIELQLNAWLPQFVKEHLNDIRQHIQLNIEDKCDICFDPHQLQHVLINLIRNAVRHSKKVNQHQVEVLVYHRDERVLIDIIDSGDGVPHNQIINLFQPFFTTEIDGTGLGLYLSRTFCEANQAKLLYIERSKGACFRIECFNNMRELINTGEQ